MASARLRLSSLYAALFFELGINLPFFPIWLRAQDLDDFSIGLVVAAPLFARILANPLVTAYADRYRRTPSTLLACATIVMVGTPFLAMTSGFPSILCLVIIIALAQGPLIALADTIGLAASSGGFGRKLDYGRMRLWGSVAFAVANLSAGTLLLWLSPAAIIGLLTVSAVATVIAAMAALRLPTSAPEEVMPADGASTPRLWRIGLVIAGAASIQASHGTVYAFSTLHWQSEGLSSGTAGFLWALGVVSEIVVLAVAGRLVVGAAGPSILVLLGGGAAIVRWLGMSLDPGILPLSVLQLSHGLTFGATHIGSILILSRLAPAGMQAQVQGWLAASWAGLMAILIMVSGRLYPSEGEHTYLLMAAVAGIGVLLLCAALTGVGARKPMRAEAV
ncbi:MFS transporter [Microvirga antarctica]|uniref:MFS transporter n=1 Tax=Microvirga antarctica TaxID=2819233 RepID=UPI001B308885|nr:MFS transporter [Microvirga antarctica]